jgi:hypothetical protein
MSDLSYNLFFLVRWIFYLVRRVLAVVYGLLEFLSKPGSRLIVPVAAIGLAYSFRPQLHRVLFPYVLALDGWQQPDPLLLDAVALLGITIALCVYVLLSRALALVLGAFPPMGKPLPPLRRLKVKQRPLRPVIVSIRVPKLPRRRWKLRLAR